MSKIHVLISGAAWAYGAQVATVGVQFMYAAFTSRSVSPHDFGLYAVSLAVVGLISLLANGGLGQTASRMDCVSPERLRALFVYGTLLGLIGSSILFLTSSIWAALWFAPEASTPIKWLCISAFCSPNAGLVSGLLRRQSRFRHLAIIVFASNATGMVVGLAAVYIWHTASTLLVAPILSVLLTLTFGYLANFRILTGRGNFRRAGSDLSFSWRLTLASLMAYANGNIGKWAATSGLGTSALGQWNRADVVTTVPFMQVQNAIIQTVYPEFRHDIFSGQRARQVWPNLLTLAAWVAFPSAAIGAVVLPAAIPIFFGSGWGVAASLSSPLVLIAAIQIVSTLLASAVEAIGRFRWIWATQAILLVIYSASAIWAISTHDWTPLIIGLFAGLTMQHAIHVALCVRAGYLLLGSLLRGYAKALVAAALGAVFAWITLALISSLPTPLNWISATTFVVLLGGSLWFARASLPPLRIAKAYRLI